MLITVQYLVLFGTRREKTVFRDSNYIRLEPVCSATKNIKKMETLHVKGVKKVRSVIKLGSC